MSHPICVFCNQANKPGREHILAEWISREFPDGVWTVTNLKAAVVTPDKPELIREFKVHKSFGIITRRPCGQCNNGWMSRLEQRVQPLLRPMIHGNSTTLSLDQQRLIMRWLVKTAMAIELSHGKSHETYFTQAERHALMRSAFIPYPALGFLARYHGAHDVACREVPLPFEVVAPNRDDPVLINGYSVTVVIRQLIIQFLTLRWPPGFKPDALHVRSSFDTAVLQVWPVTGDVTWPPARCLDDTTFDSFVMRWTPSSFRVLA